MLVWTTHIYIDNHRFWHTPIYLWLISWSRLQEIGPSNRRFASLPRSKLQKDQTRILSHLTSSESTLIISSWIPSPTPVETQSHMIGNWLYSLYVLDIFTDTGWWFRSVYIFHILGIIIPVDELIFFRGFFPQPPTISIEVHHQPVYIAWEKTLPGPALWRALRWTLPWSSRRLVRVDSDETHRYIFVKTYNRYIFIYI